MTPERATLQSIIAVIEKYDDADDKLTIALGNFNRVEAECQSLGRQLAEKDEALRNADKALRNARDGLDLGLGCARDLQRGTERERDTRIRMADRHLRAARAAHFALRKVLRAGIRHDG